MRADDILKLSDKDISTQLAARKFKNGNFMPLQSSIWSCNAVYDPKYKATPMKPTISKIDICNVVVNNFSS